ncbi:coenzyme F420:L-glutamate ligase [Cupriavidus sp. UYMU48A]|nr:coenzyme F420:L-glutamate ligase [Cupriavidus sp. UYMU48A]
MHAEIFSILGLPEIRPGDDLGVLMLDALEADGKRLHDGDILAVAQKIVSKSEGCFRSLADIVPSEEALRLAERCGKDARKVQAILDESTDILRVVPAPPDGIIIARHKQGWVCANAAIDESNLGSLHGQLLLLPEDSDASARHIARTVELRTGRRVGVIITDTFGRPWRKGLVNVAIGTSGVPPSIDWVGRKDAYGRHLAVTQQAFADEIAAASGLLMVKDAATPVVVFRGLDWSPNPEASCREYVRPLQQDLFK